LGFAKTFMVCKLYNTLSSPANSSHQQQLSCSEVVQMISSGREFPIARIIFRVKITPMPLSPFHPVIANWFHRRFKAPTDVQMLSWPAIRSGKDVLIAGADGIGKDACGISSPASMVF
jgi:hypothetical protein